MKQRIYGAIRNFVKNNWVYPLNNAAVDLRAREASLWRDGLMRMLITGSQLGRLAMTMLRVNVMHFKGANWTIIYIGGWPSMEELRYVLFSSAADVDYLMRAFLWQVPSLVRQFVSEGEFVVCELNSLIPWRPHAQYTFTTVPWVRQVLDISRPIDEILAAMNHGRRTDIRSAQRYGFSYERTHDPAVFDRFYHTMYVPYVTKRHGDRAIVEGYREKKRQFNRGGLILVRLDEQLAAGALYRVLDDTCRLGSVGVPEGCGHLVKEGAITFLCWSLVEWARHQGLRLFDLGCSRAQLKDGVFEYKRRWGTYPIANPITHSDWTFAAETIPPDLCRFINSRGFLGLLDGEWRVAMFETPELRLKKDDIKRTQGIAQRAGTAGLAILSYDESRSLRGQAIQPELVDDIRGE